MKELIFVSLLALFTVTTRAQGNQTVNQRQEQNQYEVQDTKPTATLKSSSRLFGEKDDLTTVILIIPSGSVVDVLGSDSTYYHVVFEDNEGYIFKRHAELAQIPKKIQPAVRPSRPVQEDQQGRQVQTGQQQRVSRFTYLENKYGTDLAARLMGGRIWLGMSAEMVKDSWGSPQKINRVISGNFIKEEWIYNNTWLYIENNMLREWGPLKDRIRQ